MKKLNLRNTMLSLFTVLLIAVIITGCGNKESDGVSDKTRSSETSNENKGTTKTNTSASGTVEHINVSLSSMQCGMCKKTIETAVKSLDGIESVNVDKNDKVAHIDYDKSKVDLGKIESTITAAGYDANGKKADPEAYANLDDCCKLPKDQKEKKQ